MIQEIRRRLGLGGKIQLWSGCLLAAAIIMVSHHAAAIEDNRCRGDSILVGHPALPRTLTALRRHGPLTVVAIGSSSTQGYGSTTPSQAYPAQLSAQLKLRFPQSAIHVHNKGVGGENIGDMINRFSKDVFAEKPDLVIWQTGTNDAINQVPIAQFRTLLIHGLRELRSRRIDVILMTPQYAPQFTEAVGYADYLTVMAASAAAAKVAVFDRFEPTKRWYGDQHFAERPILTKDGLHLSDMGYHCTALVLADRLAALAAKR
ncbi:MAG TPA: SGNH/GDSL hydrolase family protein [Telmatospirillum sp.]|nr:SGNH/GDSL hydrolase family protein [Telmatospirillum sp.]